MVNESRIWKAEGVGAEASWKRSGSENPSGGNAGDEG
jgi:hypothetical protein